MSADYFLDTNVLVYAFDQSAPEKQAIARSLSQPNHAWKISWQVVQEFCSVSLHRFRIPLDHDFLDDYLTHFLLPHCEVMPSRQIYQEALQIQSNTQYRFYDSLIVAAALESGVTILYSEDLQHGRQIGPLLIVNPFV